VRPPVTPVALLASYNLSLLQCKWPLGEYVLIFQPDTVLCSQSPFKIVDFLIYQYIGAPWSHVLNECGNGSLFFVSN
jgi:hypothetical protein